jgi:hypothetical protein
MMRFEPKRYDSSVFRGQSQTLEAAVEAVVDGDQMMDRSGGIRTEFLLLTGL